MRCTTPIFCSVGTTANTMYRQAGKSASSRTKRRACAKVEEGRSMPAGPPAAAPPRSAGRDDTTLLLEHGVEEQHGGGQEDHVVGGSQGDPGGIEPERPARQ